MIEYINSFSGITHEWLLATAAIAMLISLAEAWLVTLIVYGKVTFLKKIFISPQNLIRSHVDFTIMTALTGFVYFSIIHLNIELPKLVIVMYCVGVLYNPFGFFLKAIKPTAGHSDTFIGKLMMCLGFLPVTIGFGYSMIAILCKLF